MFQLKYRYQNAKFAVSQKQLSVLFENLADPSPEGFTA